MVKKKSKIDKKEDKQFHEELVAQLLTLATTAFGLVAALAWNGAIQAFVKQYIASRLPGSDLVSQIIYALIVTIFAVFVTYQLSKLDAHLKSRGK